MTSDSTILNSGLCFELPYHYTDDSCLLCEVIAKLQSQCIQSMIIGYFCTRAQNKSICILAHCHLKTAN